MATPETSGPDAEAVAEAVRAAGFGLDEAKKWGRLTFTREGDWHHWLCAVARNKSGARLVFHKGVLLADPDGHLTGSGRYVRELPGPVAVAEPRLLRRFLADALDHRTELLDDDGHRG